MILSPIRCFAILVTCAGVALSIAACSGAGADGAGSAPTPTMPAGAPVAAPAAPSPSAATSPTVTPSPTPSLSPAIDRNGLLHAFTEAQKASLSALRHRNAMELKMLDSAQSAAYKEWWAKEVQKRRQFFDDHTAGKDKRAYVQDMNARRKTFFQIQRDEHTRRIQEQKARLEAEQEAQVRNLKDFNDALKAGQVPPARLWPENH